MNIWTPDALHADHSSFERINQLYTEVIRPLILPSGPQQRHLILNIEIKKGCLTMLQNGMNRVDISQGLISESEIRTNLQTIFPDSVIVKNCFKIVAINSQITNLLGYNSSDLLEQKIDILSDNPSFIGL